MTLQKFAFTLLGLAALIFASNQQTLAWGGPHQLPQVPRQFVQTVQPIVDNGNNNQQQDVPQSGNASFNWSGYVANQDSANYTSVTGTWTVPAVSTATSGTADATWVGIGGVSSRDLIQAGTQAIVQDGQLAYSAWIETLPSYSKTVSLDVHPGDSITATITEQSEGQWLVTIDNNTTGQNYSQTILYESSHSSAEWIEEMVSNGNGTFRPLDNFGSVSFSSASATADGQSENLTQLQAEPLQMVNSAQQVLASVSNATDASFTVSRSAASAQVASRASGSRWHVIDTATSTGGSEPITTTVVRHHHAGFSYGYTTIEGIPFFTIQF